MKKLILSEIFIYSIKSMGGISVDSSVVTERGLKYDRRWLLVNEDNVFITQRLLPEMALISTFIENKSIILKHKTKNVEQISIPTELNKGNEINVQIWKDNCSAIHYSKDVDRLLNEILNLNCKLVYMPDSTKRYIDKTYAKNKEIVSFADGYAFLIIGQSSLDDLNNKLEKPIPVNRFRPNFVFTGGTPFEEDKLKKIKIGDIVFDVVKPCERCIIPTTDQETAERKKEPLLTLSTFRKENNNILFGQNLIQQNLGAISVGDEIIILERKD